MNMLPKYGIGTFISVKTYRYTLISPIIAIRNYGTFYEYVVNGINSGFIESDIIGQVDAKGNILF